MKRISCSLILLILLGNVTAQKGDTITLPSPQLDKGKPFMQVLKERKSTREFSEKKLPLQELSNLLWAANGVNREDGKRTAPSAMNAQDIDIYVVLEEGIYFFEAQKHCLILVVKGDYRKEAGKQDFVGTAPVNLIMVSDQAKLKFAKDQNAKTEYSSLNTGFVSENIYLYCSSAGLVTVTRGSVDKEALGKIMKLRPEQKITLGQTVGYPKNE